MKTVTLAWIALGVSAPSQSTLTVAETDVFAPFGARHELVNGIAFSPDGEEMYFALRQRRDLSRSGEPGSDAPGPALYSARRTDDGWSEPRRLGFSGTFEDYEPALSADGTLMVFNSKRPYPDGRMPEHNDLWMVEREPDGGWGEPARIESITSFENEESYGALTAERELIFVKGGPGPDGKPTHDLYRSRFEDGAFGEPIRHPVSSDASGEGDPWISADGDTLVFTRWDDEQGWERSVDLYISFRRSGKWSTPVPLEGLNTGGADFSPAASGAGDEFYYRAGYRYRRLPLEWILDEFRPQD